MDQSGSVSAVGKHRRRYFVAVMLLLMVTLGYADRVNMSVAGPPIGEELGLSSGTLGLLFSAFFWSYTALLVPVGWLTDRYGTRVMIPLAVVIWSVGAIATGLVNRFSTMLGARLLLGTGEAPVYPSGSMVIREWAPLKERGLFTSMLNAGALIGPAIGSVAAAYLVTQLGWRASFYILGGVGFVIAIVWALTIKRPEQVGWLRSQEREYILENRSVISAPSETSAVGGVSMSLPSLLRQAPMWGLLITQGCAVYTLYLFLTWLPTYMVEARNEELLSAGWITGIIYTAAAVFGIVISRVSDWYVSRERASGGERRRAVILLMVLSAALVIVPFVQNLGVVLTLFAWTLTMANTAVTLNIALTNDLIVDEASGGLAFGLLILGGNSFGLLAPIITGFLVEFTGSFTVPFLLAVVLLVIGALLTWTLVTRPLQPKEREELESSGRLESS
jgi:ACS family glucarate transporter-like MFS transporter